MEKIKNKIPLLLAFLLLLNGFTGYGIVDLPEKNTVVGGEIAAADFEGGVKIYVEEGYSLSVGDSGVTDESPHAIWLVSDEDLVEKILSLCSSIKQHRQVEKSSDIMLGNASNFEYPPRIYLTTNAICYSIEILNWENYSKSEWSKFPIQQELSGEPTMHIFRIDLSLMPEIKTPYNFAKEYFASDTLNSESGIGWYSTIPQESMDELLSLLWRIGPENAEKVEEVG